MSPKPLLKKFYFMSPVQVVKVTTHNIEQAAEWCGGVIKTTESRRNPGRTDRYIDVPVPKGAALVMAFPGMFITKRVVITLENDIKVTYGVFRKDFFEKNYWAEPLEAVDACWVRLANEEIVPEPVAGTNQTTSVMNVRVASPGEVGKALESARQKLLQGTDKPEIGIITVVADSAEIVETVKAEVAKIEENTEMLQFEQDVLTPAQQRLLITEDEAEQGVVPETANVVLPSYAQAKHPSLRQITASELVAEGVDINDPANYVDTFKLAGSSHDPMGVLYPREAKEALADAAEKIDRGPAIVGVVDNPEVDGSAGTAAAAEGSTEGRPSAQEGAETTYAENLKEISDGDPHR